MPNTSQYWASLPVEDVGNEIMAKVDEYYRWLETSGLLRKYAKAYNYYFGHSSSTYFSSSSDVGSAGEQGELSTVRVNHFRNLTQHLLVLTTAQRPSLEARASNTDSKSKAQTILANGILDYYIRDKRLERHLKAACEMSLVLGEGYVDMEWDPTLGEQYGVDPETQKPVHEGDIKYSSMIGPLEVCRDIHAKNGADLDWRIVTVYVNKWDLIARYPELQDAILAVPPNDDKLNITGAQPSVSGQGDLIPVRKLYHRKTEALQDGRLVVQLTKDVNLFDGPMPYTNLPTGMPLYRMTPSEFWGTPFGYSPMWDILGLQEVHDALVSTVTTNQTSFGVQNIIVPKGHDLSYQQLTGGLNLIEYDPKLGKGPEALNLTKTPPEIFNFIDKSEKTMTLQVGLNDVVKGDPKASLESGSALALVASQALQFNSGLQASYIALLEDVGTATIRMLQTFANTKRVASIAGKSERYMLKEFSGQDLQEVNRVIVDVANPLSRNISGRLQMAQDLVKLSPPNTFRPEQYIEVLETGQFRPMTDGSEDEMITISAENELLQDGQKPVMMITDDHELHIRMHKKVASMPDSRIGPQSAQIAQSLTEHIMEHINAASNRDPRLTTLLGQKQLPPPPAPPGQQGTPNVPQQPAPQMRPPGPPGAPVPMPPPGPPGGAPPPPQHPPGGPAAIVNAENPAMAHAQAVRQAALPKNPLTGVKYSPGGPA